MMSAEDVPLLEWRIQERERRVRELEAKNHTQRGVLREVLGILETCALRDAEVRGRLQRFRGFL
jgi:hypothetical protein